MMNKWNNMTPDEREKFKQEWQKRCGGWGHRSWSERTAAEESASDTSKTGEYESRI
jgi:hypothetical protein